MGVPPLENANPGRHRKAVLTIFAAAALSLAFAGRGFAAPPASAGQPSTYYLPTVYAVHKKFASGAAGPIFDSMVRFAGTDGLYQTSDGRQITLSECGGGVTVPLVVPWDETDLIQAAGQLPNDQAADAIGKLQKIHALVQANSPRDQFGPWGLFSNDERLLVLIKQFALSEFQKAHGGSAPFPELAKAQLPMVVIFLPSKGRLEGAPTPGNNRKSGPRQSPLPQHNLPIRLSDQSEAVSGALFNRSVKAWTHIPFDGTFGSPTPYVVMPLTSVSENYGRVYIKDSLPHEVAHYLGVPHVFVEEWPRSGNPQVDNEQAAALSIVGQADCGAGKWLSASAIADLDYVHSQHAIGDTVPTWNDGSNKTSNCVTAYWSRIVGGLPYTDPRTNIMSYTKDRGRYLTSQQFARAVARLNAMVGLNSPKNLCH